MIDVRTALRYIGGPSSVTWQGLLVTFIVSVAGFLTSGGPAQVTWPVRTGIVVGATLVSFVPIVVAHWLIGRRPAPRSHPALMLSLYAATAAIRGVILAYATAWVGIDTQLRLAFRVSSPVPAFLLTFAATAIVVGSSRDNAARLAELIRVNESLAQAQARAETAVAADHARAMAQITAEIQDELDGIDPALPAESARTLHWLASDVVRPLSHELAQSVPTWHPASEEAVPRRIGPQAIIEQLSHGRPFMPVATGVAITATAAVTVLPYLGLVGSAVGLTALFLGTYVALSVCNALTGTIPATWPTAARLAGVLGSLVVYGALTSAALYWAMPFDYLRTRFGAATFVITVLFSLLFAMVKAHGSLQVRFEQSLLEQNEQLRWSVARARQVQWSQQRSLARLLHGPVQSTLNAAAIRLDVALREQRDVTAIVEEVRADLRSVLAEAAGEPVRSVPVADAIARISVLWSALCDLEIDVDADATHALDTDDVSRMVLIDLLTEGASNAVNHGNATLLRMHARLDGDLVKVTIDDNGTASTKRGEAGLGSRMLNECTVSWTREQTVTGSHVEADLPVAITPASLRQPVSLPTTS